MKRTSIACIVLAAATSAHAEFMTGNDLLAKLTDKTDNWSYAVGIGYISGVHDAGRSVVHCSPVTVTMGQLGDMTRMRLEQVPAILHLSADVLILDMLKTAWPCAKKASPAML